MLTQAKLKKFVDIRNASEFASNLQVQFDASACDFCVGELGAVEKVAEGHYRWQTPYGALEEKHGIWSLN